MKQRESFAPWLFGIARRTALDVLRRRYHRRTELEWDPEQEPAPSSELDESPLTSSNRFDPEELQAGLAALSPLEREVVVLYYLQDLSLEEVAAATSTPSGTIKSRLHRARRKLRAALEDPSHE